MSLHIVGGGSFPGKIGTVSASWPLVILKVDDTRIEMDIRPPFARRIVARFIVAGADETALWSVAWDQLESVTIGQRSAVLRPGPGQRGCRFVTMTRRRLDILIAELERRSVPVTYKTSTLGWFMKPS